MFSSQSNEVNELSAAIRSLLAYYSQIGRDDLVQTLNDAFGGDKAQQFALAAAGLSSGAEGTGASLNVDSDMLDALMYLLLDTSEGAFFTKDLMTDTKLLSKFDVNSEIEGTQYDGISKFVKVVYETAVNGTFNGQSLGELMETQAVGFSTTKTAEGKVITTSLDQLASIKSMIPNQRYNTETGEVSTLASDTIQDDMINSDPMNPNRTSSPALSAWIYPNLRIGPPTRNTAAVSLFGNCIPTLEMSRCIPYINLFFISKVPAAIGTRTKQLSLLRFLGMNADDTSTISNPYDKIGLRNAMPEAQKFRYEGTLVTDLAQDVTGQSSESQLLSQAVTSAGMELFTSTQMGVNADINNMFRNYSGMSGGVLDPTQPLMTLQTLDVNVAGLGQALLANRTATMSFTLHDRSRMSDIAPLISSDLFGATQVLLEYGWQHPHKTGADENVYGAFLNAMKSRGLFNVISANFTIGNDGQVSIRLEMASSGGAAARSLPIGIGNYVPAAPLKSMVETWIARLLNSQDLQSDGTSSADNREIREIRQKLNVSLDSANSRSSVVPRSVWQQYLEITGQGSDSSARPTNAQIAEFLQELVGDPTSDDPGLLAESETSLFREVDARAQALRFTPDAFHSVTLPQGFQEAHDAGDEGGTTVSLGKLFLAFVGRPLAACGNYDEVQMMFYRFNNRAGMARDYDSVASFLVDWSTFYRRVRDYMNGFPGMSISGFIDMINSEYVNNPTDLNYGWQISNLYRRRSEVQSREIGGEAGSSARQLEETAQQREIEEIDSAIEDAMIEIYGEGEPIFIVPKVVAYFETLPAYHKKEGDETYILDPGKSILRIHIFDENATPHEDQRFMLTAMNDSEMAVKIRQSSQVAAENGVSAGVAESAEQNGAIRQSVDASSNDSQYVLYTSNISNTEIKNIIKSTVPSLTFGSQFSNLTNVSLSSNTGGSVNNVMLLRSITGGNQVQEGASNNLEEVTVIPSNARITMLGCPLVEYGQQFFVDMGTGTTADNLYAVTGINHRIGAGSFDTSLTLTFCSNGTVSTFRSVIAAAIPRLIQDSGDDTTADAYDVAGSAPSAFA